MINALIEEISFKLEISQVITYYVNSADISIFALSLPHTCRISADRQNKKKVRMCGYFPLNVTSSTFLLRLAGDEGTWPSCLPAEQFIYSGSVYILRSCGLFAKQAGLLSWHRSAHLRF